MVRLRSSRRIRAARPEAAPPDGQVAKVGDGAGAGICGALFAQRRAVVAEVDRLYSAAVCRHHWHQHDRFDHRSDVVEALDRRRSNVISSAGVAEAALGFITRSVWRKGHPF